MWIRIQYWLWRTIDGVYLGGGDHTGLEDVEFSPAIHLALYELEFGSMTFCLTVRPGRCDCSTDGGFVFGYAIGE
jgi:hypothetical protein